MTYIIVRFRYLYFVLACLLFLNTSLVYAEGEDEKARAENVRWEIAGSKIQIHYDLPGPSEKMIEIRLIMKSREDTTYSYEPLNLSGDIGDTLAAGSNKLIIWDFREEFPGGLELEKYYITIEAEVVSGSINTWLIWGGAVIGGGLIALLLFGKSSTSNNAVELPDPGGRPGR